MKFCTLSYFAVKIRIFHVCVIASHQGVNRQQLSYLINTNLNVTEDSGLELWSSFFSFKVAVFARKMVIPLLYHLAVLAYKPCYSQKPWIGRPTICFNMF